MVNKMDISEFWSRDFWGKIREIEHWKTSKGADINCKAHQRWTKQARILKFLLFFFLVRIFVVGIDSICCVVHYMLAMCIGVLK